MEGKYKMDNRINFTARSNGFLAITKKGWNCPIPDKAYSQINNNRASLEKFARKNNIKITFTDAGNMLPEFHSGSESRFLSNKMAVEVEKKPSLVSKIKTAFSDLKDKITGKDSEVKCTVSTVSYYSKESKNIPVLKENGKAGFFVDYELDNGRFPEKINLNTVTDFLQKVTGKSFK
jgi:hypothetical protein